MIELHQTLDPDQAEHLRQWLTSLPARCGACAEHDPRWLTVLQQGLGHEPYALLAKSEAGELRGYLPLALVKSRLFGRYLVSLPYLNRAGMVADDDAVAEALLARAVALGDELDVRYLELRQVGEAMPHDLLTHSNTQKQRMVLDLPGDSDTLWSNLSAKVRNQVRKGEKHDLTIRFGNIDSADLLAAFYDVFAVNMRDLGTPVYPRKLFRCILEQFPQEAELAVVEHEGQPVAAALLVHQREAAGSMTQVPSASALRRFNHTNANMWMYHQLLLRAIERGSGQFDFGRSSEDSGTWRFKKQWGAKPQPTVWQYHLRHGELDSVRPDNPRYRRRIETWQKLPVWLTRVVGPAIVRGIP